MQMREKVGKSQNTVCFPMIWGSGGSKSRLAKAAGAEPAGQMRDEKVHAVVARSTFRSQKDHFGKLRCRKSARRCGAEAHCEVKIYKTHQVRTTFGSWDVEKVHAVVVRSTFRSQKDHFGKLRCRKSARRCGAKHISKSKGPLWEVEMSKKCTPLWCEAHFEVKIYKTHQVRTTFGSWDVEKVHAVVVRSTFRSQKDHFGKLRCRKSACRCGAKHISKSKGPLWEVEMSKKCTPLWCEAHYEVKRTTLGSWDVEKVHAVVARSTFRSQNIRNTPGSDHFWKLRCRKSARRCGAKHISKSKYTKHTRFGPLLEVEMSKKRTPLWREAHFEVKIYKHTRFGPLLEVEMSKKCTPLWCETHFEVKSAKNWGVRSTFGRSGVVLRGRRKGFCTLSKVSKTWGFCSSFKNIGRRGTFEGDLQRCMSPGRRSTRDMFIRDVRKSGCWFPQRGPVFGALDL